MRDGFIFLKSFYEAIRTLPPKYRLEMYDAICLYGFNDEVSELSNRSQPLFTLIKPNMDSNKKRYLAAVENGKKGGRPKKTQSKPNENPTKTRRKPKQNLNVDADVDVDVDAEEDLAVDLDADAADDAAGFATAETCPADFSGRAEEAAGEAEDAAKNHPENNKGNAVELLPLKDGTQFPVFQADVDKWQPSYPSLDVTAELSRMRLWLEVNPNNRKTAKTICRFIVNWLNNALTKPQPKAAGGSGKPPAASQTNALGFDVNEFFDNAVARSNEIMEGLSGGNGITSDSW
jgi:hypothetical protein